MRFGCLAELGRHTLACVARLDPSVSDAPRLEVSRYCNGTVVGELVVALYVTTRVGVANHQ